MDDETIGAQPLHRHAAKLLMRSMHGIARLKGDDTMPAPLLHILSNVDRESFAASNEKLQVAFDAIYTAEDVGAYKPSDRNFDYMLEKLGSLGIGQQDILHTAESMFHDHGPANRHGLASCWIYRRYDQEGFGATMHPGEMPNYDFRFNSMADLVKAHQEALRA